MLFYEPLFLFLFFPVTFAAYLAVRGRPTARVLVLLVASPVLLSMERAAVRSRGAAHLRH